MTSTPGHEQIVAQVGEIYESESRRIFATLVGLLGNFDLAEDALQDALRAATEQWPRDGIPHNPRAWLVSTGRFKAIDALRRRARFNGLVADMAARLEREAREAPDLSDEDIPDERLRLIFTCCHPVLSLEARDVWPANGGHRPRFSDTLANACAAYRAPRGRFARSKSLMRCRRVRIFHSD